MPSLNKRIAIVLAATTLTTACGAITGYFLAREITARVIESQLSTYASQLITDGEASSAELRTILAAMGSSRYPRCSSDEIGFFRALLFESEYLQDAGRMRDGKIECSLTQVRPAQADTQFQPDFIQQDGTILYKDLAPYRNFGLDTITIQRGGLFVVFTPMTRLHLEPPPMHYIETTTDAPTQRRGLLLGNPLNASLSILSTEGKVRQGESLYATRCSIRFFNCVTTFTSMSEAVAAHRSRFFACIAFSGLSGAMTGLAASLLHRRSQNLDQQLRRALRQDRLAVVYQPVVNLASGRIVGAEALARWTGETGLAVGPDVFVPIAEQGGFIGELTALMVRRVLREFGAILRAHSEFRIGINVTTSDLTDPEFLIMLERALAQAGVSAQSMIIEITESSTVRNEASMDAIRRLRQRGHKVYIDDFGTGYSSLAYLKDLSVDAIKIDRSFTQSIGTGSVTVAILPQILAIAEALNLHVVVEGVETREQATYFADSSQAILAQGWLFGRPVPAVEFHHILPSDANTQITHSKPVPASAA